MMPASKKNPRAEYRLRDTERANLSPILVGKFPKLKSLKAELTYFDSGAQGQIRRHLIQAGNVSRGMLTGN